ncbi:MAG TPA: Bcr/CflA family drug resistance efflux transporter, partial [Clostridia bacterium]|nr:Bcr/CflA family drug resistance efflux transporter [Clostridia bacterium]
QLVRYGFILMALGATINVIANLWFSLRVPWAVLPLTVYTFGFALIMPVITILSLDQFPHRKGLASSLQGFSQVIVFAAISGVGAPLVYRSGIKHALGLATLMVASWLAYYGYRKLAAGRAQLGAPSPRVVRS